jgi:hypothetical protein
MLKRLPETFDALCTINQLFLEIETNIEEDVWIALPSTTQELHVR